MKKILAFVGLLISLYLYFSKGHVSYCPTKGCDIIANSEYARIGIFPISLIGILGYLILINFYVFYKRETIYFYTELIITTIGFLFSIYLMLVSIIKIEAICFWCVSSFIIISMLWIKALIDLKTKYEKDTG
ncbi:MULTISPECIES: vitamin K epoxide reductase family protein [Bacillus]|uniref:vitamin K epoxide reductase family protein n=1 Tax=Bacillus TaxID=1386 RepID=UPI0007A07B42|nr:MULTISPECIES: vitamin K epoxide reductase family protein [Bacillus]KYZ67746.1 hypothetical protein A3782_18235 [Bacillus sp. GZT]MCU5324847.1 vitamin K epoxide reductase family protein [Bacillus cereus]MCU5718702.1 vitamin K epoxide reductase family protein [Bacillus cereus]BCC39757.1 hypothetical protein BCJMU01_0924 [Bacillus cereus]